MTAPVLLQVECNSSRRGLDDGLISDENIIFGSFVKQNEIDAVSVRRRTLGCALGLVRSRCCPCDAFAAHLAWPAQGLALTGTKIHDDQLLKLDNVIINEERIMLSAMGTRTLSLTFSAAMALLGAGPAYSYEVGYPGAAQKPGVTLGGSSAGTPPPGIYMFDQFVTAQGSITGPNVPTGPKTSVSAAAVGFLFVPGWTFLGATYDAVIVQPAFSSNISAPVNFQAAAVHNTYVVPAELSWKLGDSGFFVKTGLGIYVPDGDILGANGLASIGNPWWTFQPEFIVSYLKDGWNLTANIFQEFNTKNQRTGYRTGDIFHAEFVATKRFDKWTLGPVGYVVSQVSNDQSSAFYNFAVNSNRYTKVAAGGLVGYDFGPVALNVWATNEFYSTASGKTPSAGVDLATVTHAWSAFASISYRLWAPDDGAAPRRLLPTK